jgi:hypothetical protein
MSATETTEATITVPAQDVQTAHLGIEGMHCDNCVARIEHLVVAGLDLVVTGARRNCLLYAKLGHCCRACSPDDVSPSAIRRL